MNPKWLAIVIMFFAAFAAKAQDKTATTPKASEQASTMTDKEKSAYRVGVLSGKSYLQFKDQLGIELDIEMIVKGIKDAYTGAALKLSDDELKEVENKWNKEIKEKQDEKLAAAAEKNKKDGKDFLDANAVKEGVMTLASSLPGVRNVQYKVITKGDGPKPEESDIVEVNFKLSLINGKELKEITNRYKPEQSVKWPVSQNIPGMKTALLNMPEGSEWEVVIPAEQAYGENGSQNVIGPNSTLVFSIKLLKILPKAEPKAETPAPAQK
jgi:FKBP-type peptidyl-prolyl cis-trans isomerase